jgi:hypothetical protein
LFTFGAGISLPKHCQLFWSPHPDFPVALDLRADNVVNRIVPLAPDLAIRAAASKVERLHCGEAW